MKIGITGSRNLRSAETVERLVRLLLEWGATELHHGDCIGWDAQANEAAKRIGIRTVAHPPTNSKMRAFCASDEIMQERPYLDRNKDIVNASDKLIAAPDGPETLRSGTWSTIRYAKKIGKNGVILTDRSPQA